MLLLLFLLLMLVLAYIESRRGLFAGATFFISVLLAGVLAYHVWEPLASEIDGIFAGDMLEGYEDAFALIIPFVISLILLRVGTDKLAPRPLALPGYVQQLGGGVFGFLSGYLLAGFFMCVLQALPEGLNIKPRANGQASESRLTQPDRVWLALMRHDGKRKTPLNFP
jgi:Colicin V production protein